MGNPFKAKKPAPIAPAPAPAPPPPTKEDTSGDTKQTKRFLRGGRASTFFTSGGTQDAVSAIRKLGQTRGT